MQAHDDGLREAAPEPEQVLGRRAGEGVDRLVRVADHAQVVAVAEPRVEQPLLQRRDVLVLVDHEVPVAAADLLRDVGHLLQRPGHDQQQVGEVELTPRAAWPARTRRRPWRSCPASSRSRGRPRGRARRRSPASPAPPSPSRSRRRGRAARCGRPATASAPPRCRPSAAGCPGRRAARRRGCAARSTATAAGRRRGTCAPARPAPRGARSRERSSPAARAVKVTASSCPGGTAPVRDRVGDAVGDRAGLAGAGAGQDAHRAADGHRRRPLLGVEPGQHPRRSRRPLSDLPAPVTSSDPASGPRQLAAGGPELAGGHAARHAGGTGWDRRTPPQGTSRHGRW